MNAVELIGRAILDLATATTIGRVGDVVVDTEGRRALGLRLAKSSAHSYIRPVVRRGSYE